MILALIVGGILYSVGSKRGEKSSEIVVSIKPIHSLVCALLKDIETPGLLLTTDASPHTYTPTPKDIESLKGAKLFIWVGPYYEENLAKLVKEAVGNSAKLTLMNEKDITLYAPREGEAWGTKSHTHSHNHGHNHTHKFDGHIWLDVQNAKIIAQACHKALIALRPKDTKKLDANLKALEKQLDEIEAKIVETLKPVRGKPYLVYHDGLQYIDRRYGTKCLGSITKEPGMPTTPKHYAAIQNLLGRSANKPLCIFSEPQYQAPKILETLRERFHVKQSTLDYIGNSLQPGPNAYGEMLLQLAKTMAKELA